MYIVITDYHLIGCVHANKIFWLILTRVCKKKIIKTLKYGGGNVTSLYYYDYHRTERTFIIRYNVYENNNNSKD